MQTLPTLVAISLDLDALVAAMVYTGIGIALFAIVWLVLAKVVPFSMRKEIEDDQNVALAVLIGSVILGISHIIASAIHG